MVEDAMDVDPTGAIVVVAASSSPTVLARLLSNAEVIEQAASKKDGGRIHSRLLRSTLALKKEVSAQNIVDFVKVLSRGGGEGGEGGEDPSKFDDRFEHIRSNLSASLGGSLDWDSRVVVDGAQGTGTGTGEGEGEEEKADAAAADAAAADNDEKNKASTTTAPSVFPTIHNPEFHELYVYLIASHYLVGQGAWTDALRLSQVGIQLALDVNARVLDPISSQLYGIMSLAAEKLDMLDQIRGTLLQLHRAAVLRHDSIGQETLLNLLLRNYLEHKLYNQAEALRAKAQPEFYKSSAQHCRLLYYHGRIQAVLLEYSDAKEALVQASRKAPQSAVGFRLHVAKWLVVVRLLLGEVPSRAELAPADLRSMMTPYFELAHAVGRGDVGGFNDVAEKYTEEFERDDLRHVVSRLRSNVIRAGVRRIASAYCRISLVDIAKKLGLSNVSDAEYIVAKAIRDGGIVAQLDHDAGTMTCNSVSDVYSTDEPLNAFHARIAFCLDVHNEAVTAIRHEPVAATKKWGQEEEKAGEGMSIEDELDDELFDDW